MTQKQFDELKNGNHCIDWDDPKYTRSFQDIIRNLPSSMLEYNIERRKKEIRKANKKGNQNLVAQLTSEINILTKLN